MIETTININKKLFSRVEKAAIAAHTSKKRVILLLFRRVMQENQKMLSFYSRVTYQKRDPDKNWHIFHIDLQADEYEYTLDMRKLCKMSVSAIIAMAIVKYLAEILKRLLTPGAAHQSDKYPFENYILINDFIDDITSWRIYWGIPRDIEKIMPASG